MTSQTLDEQLVRYLTAAHAIETQALAQLVTERHEAHGARPHAIPIPTGGQST